MAQLFIVFLFNFLAGIVFGLFYHNILPAILTFLIIEYFIYLEVKPEIKCPDVYLKYRLFDFIAYIIGWKVGKELTCCYMNGVYQTFLANKLRDCK